MVPSVEIKYDNFRAMTQELSRVSGRDYAAVLRSEAASCLKIAALKGRIASASAIKADIIKKSTKRVESDLGALVSVNQRKAAGRVWFSPNTGQGHVRGPGGNFYLVFDSGASITNLETGDIGGAEIGHHLPDDKWRLFLSTLGYRKQWIKARQAEILGRRGLERLSWLQTGDAIGVDLETVAPSGSLNSALARAVKVHGKTYNHGFATFNDAGANYTITVVDDSTVAARRQGQQRLDRAIEQRLTGFNIAAAKGMLDDLKLRARRWPGIFVSES